MKKEDTGGVYVLSPFGWANLSLADYPSRNMSA